MQPLCRSRTLVFVASRVFLQRGRSAGAPRSSDSKLLFFISALSDNPSQVSRVVVAIETLDLNDNAPELDRQYTTAMCDSSTVGQVGTRQSGGL